MNDAILIGIGTALADDPALTCRLPGMAAQSPQRVVLDADLRLPVTSRLAVGARAVPVFVFCAAGASAERERALAAQGVTVLRMAEGCGPLSPLPVLQALAARGITRLMVEGGPSVAASLVRADLVDEAVLLRGPAVIGPEGIDALDGLPLEALTAGGRLRLAASDALGPDRLSHYERI
jgi:diaminohydroxyphosphoribosylaminopyrimidine deaminase/5-amino-6-(5-phosphoribosylamino)uracil reductase